METPGPVVYDPLRLREDPYPVYRRLRAEAPLYAGHTPAGPFWALSRFEDVDAAARDWRTFSSAKGNDLDDTGLLFGAAPAMDLCDPPIHTRQRNVLADSFSPRELATRLEPLVRRKVRELVDGLAEREVVDFAHDLAYPLPLGMISDWLGFPASDREQIRAWHDLMLDRVPGRIELPEHALRARDQMWAYLEGQLAERRRRERDDLLTVLVRAQAAEHLTAGEALANALFLFDAGIVSTAALIGSALLHLRAFPDQHRLLRQAPEIIPAAVDEFLRFDAPFQWFTRVATRDVEWAHGAIPAGGRVILIWASANRDERRWEAADQLILTRPNQRHLSFSAGVHHCLGAPLARMELRILLEELMPRLADYEIVGPVERRITPSERTIIRLPARVEWARRT